METAEKRIRYKSRSDQFVLYPLGDIHAGTTACAEDRIKERIKEIKDDPFALWVGMGDYAEFIAPNDPRWDVKAIASWVEMSNVAESQRRWLLKLFEPIKDKCLGLLTGNHEETIRLHNYQDVQLDLCRDLGVKNLGFSCFYRLFFIRNKTSFAIDCHFEHGSGAAQTEGGKIMRLTRTMLGFDAEITAMGHLHDIKVENLSPLFMDEGLHIKQRPKVGAITGSWYRAYAPGPYASYAERRGYTPTNLGCPHFVIRPDKRFVTVNAGP